MRDYSVSLPYKMCRFSPPLWCCFVVKASDPGSANRIAIEHMKTYRPAAILNEDSDARALIVAVDERLEELPNYKVVK